MEPEKKKILIVEDDEFLRDFYIDLLTSEGYLVDSAADGEIGLVKMRQDGWNLVLLDIMLPKKDGLQILRDLKQESKSLGGPVVVLSNLGNDQVIKEALALGASGYLIKSALNPDEVLKEVNNYLSPSNG